MKTRVFNPFTSALFVSGILLFAVFALSSIQTRAAPAEPQSVAQQEALQAVSLASEDYTLTLTGDKEGFENDDLNFTVAITPDSQDVYTVAIAYGDGETTEHKIMQGDDTVTATYAYDKPGNFKVNATMYVTDTEIAVSNELAVLVKPEAASNVQMTLAADPTTIEPSDCVTVTAVITPLIDFDTYKAEELRLDFGNGYSPTLPIAIPYANNTPQSTMVISKYCGYDAEGTYTIKGEYYSGIYGGKVASNQTSVTVEETEEPEPGPGPLYNMTVAVSPPEATLPESYEEAGMTTVSALFWDENENFWQPTAKDSLDVTFATDFGTFTSTVTVDMPTKGSEIVTDTGQTMASVKLYSKVKGTAHVTATYNAASGKVYSNTKTVTFARPGSQEPVVGEHAFTPGGTEAITLPVSEVGSLVIPADLYNEAVTLKVSNIGDLETGINTTGLPTETTVVVGAFVVELFKTNGIQIEVAEFGSPLKLIYNVGDDVAAPYATKKWDDENHAWGEDLNTGYEEDATVISLQAATVTAELPSTGTYVKTGATVEAGPPIVYLPLIMRLQATQTATDTITSTLQLAW